MKKERKPQTYIRKYPTKITYNNVKKYKIKNFEHIAGMVSFGSEGLCLADV